MRAKSVQKSFIKIGWTQEYDKNRIKPGRGNNVWINTFLNEKECMITWDKGNYP